MRLRKKQKDFKKKRKAHKSFKNVLLSFRNVEFLEVALRHIPIHILALGGDEDNFWKDVLKKSYLFIFPISTPETLQALKLPPSAFPCGMATVKVWVPAGRYERSKYTGWVAVPGHQPERE